MTLVAMMMITKFSHQYLKSKPLAIAADSNKTQQGTILLREVSS